MKKLFLFASLLLPFSLSARLSIAISEHAEALEKMAAAELSEHLAAALGKDIPLVTGNPTGQVIFIGSHPQAQAIAGKKDYREEEWQICARDANTLAITGGWPRGLIYGVYEFLETQVGVIWMDEWSTHIPKLNALVWKADLKMQGEPSFPYRGVYTYFGADRDLFYKFLVRNRMNHFHDRLISSGAAFERGVSSIIGRPRSCHTFYNYTKDYGKDEEECFSWSINHQARRRAVSSSGPGQVCFTNPKTAQLFLKKLRQFIQEDEKQFPEGRRPVIYCIMTNDNAADCECADCLKAAGELGRSGLLITFINTIARDIKKTHPQLKIMTAAYLSSKYAPASVRPDDNVMVEIALLGGEYSGEKRHTHRSYNYPANAECRKIIEDWSKLCTVGIWDYWILNDGRGNYPANNTYTIVENLKFYKECNVKFIFAECERPNTISLHALRLWLGLQAMNNLDLDVDKAIDRFLQAYFGKAAPYLRQYHDMLQAGNDAQSGSLCDLPLNRRSDLNDEFFRKCEELFLAAEQAEAGNPVILERLGREQISINWARIDKRGQLAPDLKPDVETAVSRLQKNYSAAVNRYIFPQKRQALLDEMDMFCQGIKAQVPPLQGFEDKQVLADFAWPVLSTHRNASTFDDPDAFGSKAVGFIGKEGKNEDARRAHQENRGIKMGVYDFHNRVHLCKTELPKEVLPQDETYHWYSTGRLHLSEKCFLWMHWSWLSQQQLRAVYDTSDLNNDVEIFVHLKVQGPNYVKGSTRPNVYAIDRVVICKAGIGGPGPVAVPLPPELAGRKAYADLVGTTLPVWRYEKVYDTDSEYGTALCLDTQGTHENRPLMIGFYDGELKRVPGRLLPEVPQDEKYHLYSLGVFPIPANGYVFAHSSCLLRIDLSRCANLQEKNKRYEIVLSVKAQGPAYVPGSTKNNAVYIDRMLLLEPK